MNSELVVIAGQSYRGEYVLASCTHRPSNQQSRENLNPASGGREFIRRWGLSRNKVSVLEGADGSPPFFFLFLSGPNPIIELKLLYFYLSPRSGKFEFLPTGCRFFFKEGSADCNFKKWIGFDSG